MDKSPALSDSTETIEDFISFSCVDPDSVALSTDLLKLGITHWTMFVQHPRAC
ncbi:hypothetical protein VP01_3507g3 [Puccinia sorghi]|uniref:Uncharacterized protein n=1 Tax=Puccinia sorghi TaxID=27349 RepID=A0A0L6UXK9_9BASI|nr:hypothetical protein VP01_3507g3 [Puccinia sorghi]